MNISKKRSPDFAVGDPLLVLATKVEGRVSVTGQGEFPDGTRMTSDELRAAWHAGQLGWSPRRLAQSRARRSR